MRILCLVGRHRRSRRHARDEGMDLVSQCKWCGRPMRKCGDGDWFIDKGGRDTARNA